MRRRGNLYTGVTTELIADAMVQNEGNTWAGSGANPWHLDAQTESFLFLTNEGDKPARIGLCATASGVHYYLTMLVLAPHETRSINIRQLRDAQIADFKGNKIPAAASDGSVNWIRLDNVPVTGRLMVIQRHNGLIATYDCCCCSCAAPFFVGDLGYSVSIEGPTSVAMGSSAQLTAFGLYQGCNGGEFYSSVGTMDDPPPSWSSSNTSVATVDSPGSPTAVTGVSSGTAQIQATWSDCGEWVPNNDNCVCQNMATGTGSCPITVTPMITSISPAQGPISLTTSVTIAGSGFGTNPTVNVGSNSGITVTINSASNTQIQASFQVSATATGGNVPITVTASGKTSNSSNFLIQVPTSLSIVAATSTTTQESSCETSGGLTGCGVTRSFTYQVNDQNGNPIQAGGLPVWDAITTTSPNNLNLTSYATTCGGPGPCGPVTTAAGQFGEDAPGLTVCAPACHLLNSCNTGGPTDANQVWHIGPGSITQQLSYYCDHILVNGQ